MLARFFFLFAFTICLTACPPPEGGGSGSGEDQGASDGSDDGSVDGSEQDAGLGCDTCPDGTALNSSDCLCEDIDECLTNNGGCGDARYIICTNNKKCLVFGL